MILLHDSPPLLAEELMDVEGLWVVLALRSDDGDSLPLLVLGLEPLARMVRMAGAPKLMRRVKGVVGAVRLMPSSSSIAFSSIESELVDMLDRRALNDAVGELARPRVEIETRRPRSLVIAVEMGPGMFVGACEMELLRNMLARPPMEPRRGRASPALLLLLSDMMEIEARDTCRLGGVASFRATPGDADKCTALWKCAEPQGSKPGSTETKSFVEWVEVV